MGFNHNLSHLAIIMDGNRRWAKKRGLPTLEGHSRGYGKLKDLCQWSIERGIKILTVYAFSTENWHRSRNEVKYLMDLLRQAFKNDLLNVAKKGVRIKVIGQRERLAPDIRQLISEIEDQTKNNKRLILNLAISYGGRPEIVWAVKKIINQKIPADKVSEAQIEKNLWTKGLPDPELIIRTSGEQRLSNFLTWQSAYSEFLFLKKHWPDFSQKDLDDVIKEYTRRQRRFGR